MLTYLIPTIMLLALPKTFNLSWHMTPPLLIILTFLSMTKTLQYSSYLSESSLSSMDSLSGSLTVLTFWISSLMILASTSIKHTKNNSSKFILMIIILLVILIMCFNTSHTIYFYILFEASLVPTTLLIMLWGYQPERIQASMYLMMYTVVASLPLLMMIILIIGTSKHQSMAYPFIATPHTLNPLPMYLMLSLAFLVKLPLFLVHLWLPKAHVEAPVSGSMILAAILLKLGGYGLIRISTLFIKLTQSLSVPVISTALVGAISTSLICLRQTDLKSIIAYSSIGHMGLMCVGVFSGNSLGLNGALMMMIAHAFSSSALFCMSNITYEMAHTRSLSLVKGTILYNPMMSMWWFMLICMNMAAPPSINLLSEIFLIISSMAYSTISFIPIILMSFMNVAYSLFMYASINHGHMLSQTNPMSSISVNYSLLILMHLLPGMMLILCPNLLTMT